MSCYNCENLKKDNKKEGKVNGSLYFCSKFKTYVNGATDGDGCEKYKKDIMRKTYENDEIYRNGKHYFNDDRPIDGKIILIVILVIIAIIVNVL